MFTIHFTRTYYGLYFRTIFIPKCTYVIGLRLDNGLHKYSANSRNSHVYLICNTLAIRSDQRTRTMQNVSITHKTSKGYFPLPRKTCHFSFRTAQILNTQQIIIPAITKVIHTMRYTPPSNSRLTWIIDYYSHILTSSVNTKDDNLLQQCSWNTNDVSYISCPWNHGSQVLNFPLF